MLGGGVLVLLDSILIMRAVSGSVLESDAFECNLGCVRASISNMCV